MSTVARRSVAWLLIGLGGVWVAWQNGRSWSLGDYTSEFAPAMNALLAGHLHAFAHLLPSDGAGGSLLLRAPAALAGKLLVGGQVAIFRFGALASELAAGALGLVLARDMRERGVSIVSRVATVALCVFTAALLDAIFFAHPEETLGATLCVGAVLLSGAGRPALAGLALGCAIINKPWGVLALAPVALASQAGLRRTAVGAFAVVLPWIALAYGFDPARLIHQMSAASSLALVAHPVDLWWPLDHAVRRPGTTPYYAPPAFLVAHAREIAVLLMIPLSVPLALRRVPGLRALLAGERPHAHLPRIVLSDRAVTDAGLALLALLMLVRCMLDPSNHVYYQVPFVLALLAWDSRVARAPVRALLGAGLLWLIFHTISGVAGLSLQFLAYTLVTVPCAVMLLGAATAGAVRWPPAPRRRLSRSLAERVKPDLEVQRPRPGLR
jgi:hypothetical protein